MIYLGHNLINSPAPNFEDDMICTICNIRLEPNLNEDINCKFHLVKNFTLNVAAGEIFKFYNLTCEEQQIKNLLE